jgi:hypothetical protein
MGVVRLKYRMLILKRTTPSLALPLHGGGNLSPRAQSEGIVAFNQPIAARSIITSPSYFSKAPSMILHSSA